MSAIAETGAMLLNGQGRASASNSAVAAALSPPLRSHDAQTLAKFLAQRRRRCARRDSLLTGGLLVRIQPEEPSFQRLTAILILHNFADEVYGSEPDGCARFSSRIHGRLLTALNNPIAERRKTMAVLAAHDWEFTERRLPSCRRCT